METRSLGSSAVVLRLICRFNFPVNKTISCKLNIHIFKSSRRYNDIVFSRIFQRLIPVDSGNDLFVYKAPEVPTSKIYTIRPYMPADEDAIYAVCNRITGVTGTSAVADRYFFVQSFYSH